MAIDLNDPPGFEDDDAPAAGGLPDLNIPASETEAGGEGGPSGEIPVAAVQGGSYEDVSAGRGPEPVGIPDLNLDPDLDDEDNSTSENGQPSRRNQATSKSKRDAVYKNLLELSPNGNLKNEQMIGNDAKKQMAEGVDVDVSRKKKAGRKPLNIDWSQVSSIPYHRRSTIRSLAMALQEKGIHIHPSTLHKKFKLGIIRRHSRTVKPFVNKYYYSASI